MTHLPSALTGTTYRPEIVLRTAPKVKMKVDFTDKERVRRSPYYICNEMRDKLDSCIQTSSTILKFSKKLLHVNFTGLY